MVNYFTLNALKSHWFDVPLFAFLRRSQLGRFFAIGRAVGVCQFVHVHRFFLNSRISFVCSLVFLLADVYPLDEANPGEILCKPYLSNVRAYSILHCEIQCSRLHFAFACPYLFQSVTRKNSSCCFFQLDVDQISSVFLRNDSQLPWCIMIILVHVYRYTVWWACLFISLLWTLL